MFKLTESDSVRTLDNPVELDGYETVPASATIPKGHRLYATFEAWVAAGNTPEPHDTRTDGEKWAEAVKQKLEEIKAASTSALQPILADYPDYERMSWARQEEEARAGGGPLIDKLAATRGIDSAELITRIIAKADAYTLELGRVTGIRQRLEDDVLALPQNDYTALAAVVWSQS